MSVPETFSVAVVHGPGVGQVLRTERKRISIGRGDDNDLILEDREIAARHFLILIDQGRWRIHTFSPDRSITVDRRWSHPATGRRGALVKAGAAELILFPGILEPLIIDREIKLRANGESPNFSEAANPDNVTQIGESPAEFGYEDAGSMPTIPVPKHLIDSALAAKTAAEGARIADRRDDPELVKLSMMPTVAGERPPDDLREAARLRLREERAPLAPSLLLDHEKNQPVRMPAGSPPRYTDEKTAAVGWDEDKLELRPLERVRKSGTGAPIPGHDTDVDPRIEERMGSGPGPRTPQESGSSAWERAKQRSPSSERRDAKPDLRVLKAPPPDGATIPVPEVRTTRGSRAKSEPIPEVLAVADSDVRPVPAADGSKIHIRPILDRDSAMVPTPLTQESLESLVPSSDAPKAKNAWGDPFSRVQPAPVAPPTPTPKEKKTNAWGESAAERNGRALAHVPRAERAMIQPSPAHIISVQDLAKRAKDPALAILQDPDGEFATSIRLFSTKLEEYMRTLGYRAYMMTSAEPLTGKTTAACNLAFALAEDTHRRVALVEANFRNPRLAEIFGIAPEHGLIPLLEGRVQIAETIVKMSDRNLVIMPSGGKYPHPGELLASPRFKMLIQELANTVDIAVIDAPPVSTFADANMLLPLLDAAVLVVAEGRTRVNWVAEAGAQLGMTRIIGGLYNRLPKAVLRDLKLELKSRMTND